MKKVELLTITGDYWHFHPIGTGTIFTYHTKAKQVLITCVSTGRLVNVVDKYEEGGYETPEQFKKASTEIYMMMASEDSISLDLGFYSNTTYVGDSMIEVDFDLMKN